MSVTKFLKRCDSQRLCATVPYSCGDIFMESDKQNGTNFQSSGLRQKVDQLMDILYSGGVNNPMDSIEQLSYLIFLRLLTEKDELLASLDKKHYQRIFSGNWSRYAWGNFVTSLAISFLTPSVPPSKAFTNCPAFRKPASCFSIAPRSRFTTAPPC